MGKSVLFFSQSYTGGHTPCCQSVARQVGCVACGLPGVSPLSGGSNACVAGGMIMPPKGSTQRGIPPLGDSLVTFSSGRKLPGARGGAPAWWVQELSAPQKPPGRRAWQGHALAERLLWGVQRGRSPLASSSRSCGAERLLNPPLLFGIYRKEDKFFLSSTKTFCRNASPLCNTREIQKTLETAPFSSYNENRILPPGSLLHRAEEIGKTRRI